MNGFKTFRQANIQHCAIKQPHCILVLDSYTKFDSSSLPFTCEGEKKEVTDPGIRYCPPNVGVAQLCQVLDLSIYTQTSALIG